MAIEFDPTEQWHRVASELRAVKETQQQAWGDIDNATLGRYLAGELSGEERARVEQALTQYPELLKLTDVVRDVLEEFDPAAPQPLPAAPKTLPFAQARPARKPFARVLRQRGALVAAAAVLLALGLSLGGMHLYTRDQANREFSFFDPQASRHGPDGPVSDSLGKKDGGGERTTSKKPLSEKEITENLARVKKKVTSLGAMTLEQMGTNYQESGDYDRAETYFVAAHDLRRKTFGEENAETLKSTQNLAHVYEVALNTVPPAEPPAPRFPPMMMSKRTDADKALALRERITRQEPAAIKQSVVPVLVQGLRGSRTAAERRTFVRALGTLGPAAADAVPDLMKALDNSGADEERTEVVRALGQMGQAGSPAVPALVATLKCDCPEARREAGESLVRLCPYARQEVLAAHTKEAQLPREVLDRIEGPEGRVGVNDTGLVLCPHDFHETQREILLLARKHHVEVYTETVASLPAKGAKSAEERAKEVGATGLYLLICKEPPGVQVVASEALQKKGFTAECVAELKKVAEEGVQKRQYDRSVVQSVRYVAQRFEPAAAPVPRRPNPALGGCVGVGAKTLP
jgi:hypothetical protein